MNDNKFWLLEKTDESGVTFYYAGACMLTLEPSSAFRYGTKDLANLFLSQAKNDSRIKVFADYEPYEYELIWRKVEK